LKGSLADRHKLGGIIPLQKSETFFPDSFYMLF